MRNIFRVLVIVIALFIAFNSSVYAQDKIEFIYIHGTNDNNEKKKKEFTEDVNRLHKQLVSEFSNSALAKQYLMDNGKYTISEEPVVFYWGGESKEDLNLLSEWLDITKFFSPKIAQTVRTMIAHSFHDAIWIQKYNNMTPILSKLQDIALKTEANNDKYVLVGHSAGSFITYEYFIYKVPIVDIKQFFAIKQVPQDKMKEIEKIGYRTTCIDAMIDSGLAIFKRDYTFYIPQDNLVENYKKLAEAEKTACVPKGYLGLINFGSPLSLFYSGFADNSEMSETDLIKAVLNNDIFYLNLNFAEDPLGFPAVGENHYPQILAMAKDAQSLSCDANDENAGSHYGFIYDKSNIRSNKAVFNAHMAYWRKAKFFAKAIVKAYEEGLNIFLN